MDIKSDDIIKIFSDFVGWKPSGGTQPKDRLAYILTNNSKTILSVETTYGDVVIDLDLCIATVNINDSLDTILAEISRCGHNVL